MFGWVATGQTELNIKQSHNYVYNIYRLLAIGNIAMNIIIAKQKQH